MSENIKKTLYLFFCVKYSQSKYGDFFKEREQKRHQELQTNFRAIKYVYKLFTKIITTTMEKKVGENQPREQAGFRSKYSITDDRVL